MVTILSIFGTQGIFEGDEEHTEHLKIFEHLHNAKHVDHAEPVRHALMTESCELESLFCHWEFAIYIVAASTVVYINVMYLCF